MDSCKAWLVRETGEFEAASREKIVPDDQRSLDVKEKLVELLRNSPYLDIIKGYKGNDCTFEQGADWLITNGVTVQEWISVKEPPKKRGCYLVTVKHWLDGKPVVREARWNGVDWLSCYKKEELTPRVTHWRYLPKPAEGE